MLNIIIASDNDDHIIGDNCQESFDYLSSQIDLTDLSTVNSRLLDGKYCHPQYIEESIISFNEQRFILIAYSHGVEDALTSSYAENGHVTTQTAYMFATSLVYTNSCLSGKSLRQALIDENCHGYVGYTGHVNLPNNCEDEPVFIACENSGLIHFLTSDDSLTDSVEVMRQFYQDNIDQYFKQDMIAAAFVLEGNLNLLVHHEAGCIRRADFL